MKEAASAKHCGENPSAVIPGDYVSQFPPVVAVEEEDEDEDDEDEGENTIKALAAKGIRMGYENKQKMWQDTFARERNVQRRYEVEVEQSRRKEA